MSRVVSEQDLEQQRVSRGQAIDKCLVVSPSIDLVLLVIEVRPLHVPRKELPNVSEMPGLIGVQRNSAIEHICLAVCPGDAYLTKVTTTAGV